MKDKIGKMSLGVKMICWLLLGSLKPELKVDLKTTVNFSQNWKVSQTEQLVNIVNTEIRFFSSTTTRGLEDCIIKNAVRICPGTINLSTTGKIRNKYQRTRNGNGTNRQNVTIIHWNMGAKIWTRKMLEIEAIILQYTPDIYIISEANLPRSLSEDERRIAGYNILTPPIPDNHNLYRLVVLVKDGMDVKVINELSDENLSALWLKTGTRGRRPMIIGAMYREFRYIHQKIQTESGTDREQMQRWNQMIEKWKIAARMGDVTVIGDINLDFARWGNPDTRIEKLVEKVKLEVETLNFNQIVESFTRSWNSQPDSLLDHIWMNSPSRLIYYRNVVRTFSDHNVLIVSYRTKDKNQDKHDIVQRDRRKYDPQKYSEKIANIDWEDFFDSTDIEKINSMFEEKLLNVLNQEAPIKISQKRKLHRNWISADVKTEMRYRDCLRQTARRSGSQDDWDCYKTSRNKCVKLLAASKKEHYNKIYEKIQTEKDTRSLYNLTYELMDKKRGTTPQALVSEGRLIRKPRLMANLLVNFYENKVKNLINKIPTTNRDPHRFIDMAMRTWEKRTTRPDFHFREISLSETLDLISKMSKSGAMGHDNIDGQGIKDAKIHLVRQIRHLVNTSLITGRFARKWKFAKISPRLKSQDLDKCSVNSYRPVAILSVTSKIIERAAQIQLLKYLESTEQLNASNHAYRQIFSTTMTLMEILDDIYEGAEQRRMTSLMAVDQTAAFDTVDHHLLVEKLRKYGLGTSACEWIDDYLKSRTQYVVLGRAASDMKTVRHGVPQGSVIGPLLYAIYVNDLSETVKRTDCTDPSHSDRQNLFGRQCRECGILTSYADDSTYTCSSRIRQRNQVNIERALEEIQKYLTDNKLFLNLPKTQIMEIMTHQKRGKTNGLPPSLEVTTDTGANKIILDKQHTRILGSNIQKNMFWKSHVESGNKALFPQVRRTLGMLRHLGDLIPKSCRRNLASGLVISKLSYLMPLWGTAAESHIRKAQILLNAAARWVTGLHKSTRIRTLMTSANWFTIKEQIQIAILIQTWKLVHWKKPPRMLEHMLVNQDLQIETSRPRLIFSSECYRWKGAELWNNLDTDLRKIKSLGKFKVMIKRRILENREQEPPD